MILTYIVISYILGAYVGFLDGDPQGADYILFLLSPITAIPALCTKVWIR